MKRSKSVLSFGKGLILGASFSFRYLFGYGPPPIVENEPDYVIKVGMWLHWVWFIIQQALDVFSLPCGCVYHMLCLAYMGKATGHCVEQACMQVLPKRVQLILGISPLPLKVEENYNGKLLDTMLCIYIVGYYDFNYVVSTCMDFGTKFCLLLQRKQLHHSWALRTLVQLDQASKRRCGQLWREKRVNMWRELLHFAIRMPTKLTQKIQP